MTAILDHADYDSARLELLRRRVMVVAFVIGVLLIALSITAEIVVRNATRPMRIAAAAPGVGGLMMMSIGVARLRKRSASMTLKELIWRTTVVVSCSIILQIPASRVVAHAIEDLLKQAGFSGVQISGLAPLFISMLAIHLSAAIVLPWSLWESVRPVIVIVFFALIFTDESSHTWSAKLGGVLGLALMGLPGMVVSWLRFSRFRQIVTLRFLSTRYVEVQRELETARRIHEKLFPQPITTGPVRFDFRYEPMRQIGGDIVGVVKGADSSLTVVLVDVTGHGIAAALAVNRLHAELRRAIALQPEMGPARIIASLNEYVCLTLADESVFATALAAMIEPAKTTITWSSAGHPPAFVCRADGKIELLDSTAIMLGAIPGEMFDAAARSIDFTAGDVLIAYTDGGIECRDARDQQLGIEGLRALVESSLQKSPGKPAANLLDAVMAGIGSFRSGPPEDDTLILAATIAPENET